MHVILWLLLGVVPIEANRPVDFDNQIIPVLTKAGCNTGACHGAAVGRGGFRLSLYGGDPLADYESIALELEGRRINLAHPEQSLLLLKPTESIAHGGGYRLEDDGPGAQMLQQWVQQGAARLHTRQLVDFQVSPPRHVAQGVGEKIKLTATATFSDGGQVDVTRWTVFTAEDPTAIGLAADDDQAEVLRRGRHIVIARYLDRVVPLEVLVPLRDEPIDLTHQPRNNLIDTHVLELLQTLRIPVSDLADEATFLRRLTLHLTGRLPSLAATQAFASDRGPHKRERMVDQLLASQEFTEYWTLQLAKLLRIRPQPNDTQGAETYHHWLRQQLSERVPYDQLARSVLTATGDSHAYGPANFYRTVAGAREQAEFVSELFMGSRLRCANCHNHPLDRWTQDDYHGLAAIFAKVESGRIIKLASAAEITHPRTGDPAQPRIPGDSFLSAGVDERQALADWLTAAENPYFAKAIVNRLWKAMFGRGLIEPADDLRSTNPATHPQLLTELADDFVAHGFDLRHTLRCIAVSNTYARSSQSTPHNQADDRYYSHAFSTPLPPEVLADAISDVTGVSDQYGDTPLGTRAVALFDPTASSVSLDVLGRCGREESCEASDVSSGGMSRMLHLFNGPLLNRRLSDPQSRLVALLAEGKPAAEIVDEFYQRAFARSPTSAESRFWEAQLASVPAEQTPAVLQDFVWSLLTCREFVTNH